jgi:hypothetical protein
MPGAAQVAVEPDLLLGPLQAFPDVQAAFGDHALIRCTLVSALDGTRHEPKEFSAIVSPLCLRYRSAGTTVKPDVAAQT